MSETLGSWKINNVYCSDAIAFMMSLPSASVDMILVDPPYGTTNCKWDEVIPLQPMWDAIRRVAKPSTAIVITAAEPFKSVLNCSNLEMWRFDYTWPKTRVTGFLDVEKKPLKAHENISVFSITPEFSFFPQLWQSHKPKSSRKKASRTDVYGHFGEHYYSSDGERQPTSVLMFSMGVHERGWYPTQKPVKLFKHLIRQHSRPNGLVLDFAMGSGTTGAAALETGRRFIGCDISMDAVEIARSRLDPTKPKVFENGETQLSLFAEVSV